MLEVGDIVLEATGQPWVYHQDLLGHAFFKADATDGFVDTKEIRDVEFPLTIVARHGEPVNILIEKDDLASV